ncbi:ankyrin repeat domain-containing protein [Moheibacter lacus]|uniref:Ankyrin repeat domain-containing protein n=1 Tax=Moheibacter lacus TaxID=2745851 RepID=A0A838ZMI6_9FLAO|nr:ankyrin repeat domain-containing protein [Moheibacter lacus]MBA5628806.1 ankyrin repeat domain-containing protein [Moheibacter lacus]
MKKILIAILLTTTIAKAQDNSMLAGDFWKQKPDVETVKAEITKGNNPAQANRGNHDVVSFAINNEAPLATILYLIDQPGNSIDKTTHDGRLYLHWAANRGNVELVKYLIDQGSEINRTDDKGATPISFAAGNGQTNPAIYELFFKAGIDPKQKYKNGANLLLLSISHDADLKLSDYLTTKGLSLKDADDLGRTVFDYAARNGNIDLLKNLQKKGVKATGSALIIASQGSRWNSNGLDVYKYLVEEVKLDPKTKDENGANVLFNLVRNKDQEEIIQYFLEKGVDFNSTDKEGNNAFMEATATKNIDLVKSILPKVKDLNAVNAKGESALFFAVQSSSPEMVSYLIENGAKTNFRAKDGNLAFYLFQSYRPARPNENADEFADKLNILVDNGVDFRELQENGSSLYHVAASKNDLNLFRSLEKLNIDLNVQDKDGMTALHKAALMAKDDSILKYLVSLGAKKDIQTEFEETAYDLALENEFLQENITNIEFLK